MEEFDSEDFSTSDEDEDYVPSGKRFGLRRKEGGSHASRLTRDFPGPQGVGLVVARPPRRVGSGVPVLRTLAPSRPGTRVSVLHSCSPGPPPPWSAGREARSWRAERTVYRPEAF